MSQIDTVVNFVEFVAYYVHVFPRQCMTFRYKHYWYCFFDLNYFYYNYVCMNN